MLVLSRSTHASEIKTLYSTYEELSLTCMKAEIINGDPAMLDHFAHGIVVICIFVSTGLQLSYFPRKGGAMAHPRVVLNLS